MSLIRNCIAKNSAQIRQNLFQSLRYTHTGVGISKEQVESSRTAKLNPSHLEVIDTSGGLHHDGVKEQLKDSLDRPSIPHSSKILDKCKLLQIDVEKTFSSMNSEELWPFFCPDRKKRKACRYAVELIPSL